jgi:acetoin utilization deacetylase AcuC-like enzyme
VTTLLVHHPAFLEHLTPTGHPERPERLRALHAALGHADFAALERIEAPLGDPETATLAHPADFVEAIRRAVPEAGFAGSMPTRLSRRARGRRRSGASAEQSPQSMQ